MQPGGSGGIDRTGLADYRFGFDIGRKILHRLEKPAFFRADVEIGRSGTVILRPIHFPEKQITLVEKSGPGAGPVALGGIASPTAGSVAHFAINNGFEIFIIRQAFALGFNQFHHFHIPVTAIRRRAVRV